MGLVFLALLQACKDDSGTSIPSDQGSCRQADAVEVGPNRDRVRQGSDNLHLPPAVGAFRNVNGKHARQQLAPGQAMGTGLVGRLGLHLGLVCASRHDPGAASSSWAPGSRDTVSG